jgi:hypothetical protein
MKKILNFYDFCDEFGGSQYENNFSYNGKKALFEYLEQYEEDTGEEMELDIIALCCDYDEHDNALSCAIDYGFIPEETEEEEQEKEAMSWLEDRTQVIKFEDGIIIQNF